MVDLHLRGARDAEDMWLSSSGDEDEEAALVFCKREDDGGELTRQLLLQTQPASSPGSSCSRPSRRAPPAAPATDPVAACLLPGHELHRIVAEERKRQAHHDGWNGSRWKELYLWVCGGRDPKNGVANGSAVGERF
jgi:hypothetical protein